MTTSAVAEREGAVVQGRVSPPPAIASAVQSANYKFAQVMKEIIVASPHAFQSENQQLEALAAVDSFLSALVPNSARRALADIPARAPVEDVSKRVPPAGAGYSLPYAGNAAIDYDKLAAAIVRAQYAQANAEVATTDEPAPADDTETSEDNG